MVNEESDEVVVPVVVPAPRSRRKAMLMAGAAVVFVLGGGLFFGMHGKSKAADAQAADKAAKATELFLPLDPAFIVNFQDQDATRYLQVGVTVMTRDPLAVQAIKDNDPVIRNALVMLFSSQSYAQLSDTAGKQKLQAEALAAVRKVVADTTGKPDVEALYFTSFVMQ